MAEENSPEHPAIESGLLTQQEQPLPILGTTGLNHDRSQMLGAKNICRSLPHLDFPCLEDGLRYKRIVSGQELDRDPLDEDMFMLLFVTQLAKTFVYGRKRDQAARRRFKQKENVQVIGQYRLGVKYHPERTADRISLKDSLPLKTIYDAYDRLQYYGSLQGGRCSRRPDFPISCTAR